MLIIAFVRWLITRPRTYAYRWERYRAEKPLRPAADDGNALAAYELGSHLLESSRQESSRWAERRGELGWSYLRKAAEGNHPATTGKVGERMYWRRHSLDDAIRYLRIAADAGDARATYVLACALAGRDAGRREWIPSYISRRAWRPGLAEAHPMFADGAGQLANLHLFTPDGADSEVLACLRRAAELGNDSATEALGLVLLVGGGPEREAEAETHLWRAAKRSPLCSAELAALFARQGRYDEAERYYRQAVRHPDHTRIYWWTELGRLLERMGRADEATGMFEEARRLRREVEERKNQQFLREYRERNDLPD